MTPYVGVYAYLCWFNRLICFFSKGNQELDGG